MRNIFSKTVSASPNPQASPSVRPADAADLARCIELERELSPARSDASERGFLLPGSTRDDYFEYLSRGVFLVAELGDTFAGYLTALPAGHPRISRFRGDKRFVLDSPEALDFESLYWVGKLAVRPSLQRRGVGTSMYRRLFEQLPDVPIATAIMIAPIEDRASLAIHEALEFVRVGTYSAERGSKGPMVCGIYSRAGR
jgi:GNAT superfamily N-acetyltransferase